MDKSKTPNGFCGCVFRSLITEESHQTKDFLSFSTF